MKTFRPDYMNQSNIPVFQAPRTNSYVICSIPIGEEVEVLQKRIRAIDPETGTYYVTPIWLCQIKWDGKTGYVNGKWLR